MSNIFDIAKKERKEARITIYVEVFFVVLPIIMALVINGWKEFTFSDFSLGAAIVFGQTLFRFSGGLTTYKGKDEISTPRSLFMQALILLGLIISTMLYTKAKVLDQMNIWLIVFQILLFILSIWFFIVFGGIGQWLSDRGKR